MHFSDIDQARNRINDSRPAEGLRILEHIRDRVAQSNNSEVLYKYWTNLAAAHYYLGNSVKSAEGFLTALKYRKESHKALCNAALGYLQIKESEKAKTLISKAIDKNPAYSQSYVLSVLARTNAEAMDAIERSIPEWIRQEPDIQHALGQAAYFQGDINQSITHLRKAKESMPSTPYFPDIDGFLGTALLSNVAKCKTANPLRSLTDDEKSDLKQALECFDLAWGKIELSEMRRSRINWLANRAVVKNFLGQFDESIRDLEKTLEIVPNDVLALKNLALFHCDNGDLLKAEGSLRNVLAVEDDLESRLLLADLLSVSNKTDEAIGLIKEVDQENLSSEDKRRTAKTKIRTLTRSKNFCSAGTLIAKQLSEDPDDIDFLILESQRLRGMNETSEALESLQRILIVKEKLSPRQMLVVGNELQGLGQHISAAELFQKVPIKFGDDPISRQVVDCFYKAGMVNEALQACIEITAQGPVAEISMIQSAIFLEIGDLRSALDICLEVTSSSSNSFDKLNAEILAANIYARTREFSKLDAILENFSPGNTCPFQYYKQLSVLAKMRDKMSLSLSLMHRALMAYPKEKEVLVFYVTGCQSLIGEVDQDPAVVHSDDFVTVESVDGVLDTYNMTEIGHEHPIYEEVIGKGVGHAFTLGGLNKTIKKIESKYSVSFQESLNTLNRLFPSEEGFSKIEAGGDGAKEMLNRIVNNSQARNRYLAEVDQWYIAGKFTVGGYAHLCGVDTIQAWARLTTNENLEFRVCSGAAEERAAAADSLLADTPLVFDVTSLITIQHNCLFGPLSKMGRKLIVPRSVVDIFQELLIRSKLFDRAGSAQLGVHEGKIYKEVLDESRIEKHQSFLSETLDFLFSFCDVVSCGEALTYRRDQRIKLEETMGKPSFDAILVAKQHESVLYSDDFALRMIAQEGFNVKGTWTELVVYNLASRDLIDNNQAGAALLKQIKLQYRFVPVTAEVLLAAAAEDNWAVGSSYSMVSALIRQERQSGAESLAQIVFFVRDLLRMCAEGRCEWGKMPFLVNNIVRAACVGRDPATVIELIARGLGMVEGIQEDQREPTIQLVRRCSD